MLQEHKLREDNTIHAEIHQDNHRIMSTMRHAAALHPKSSGATVDCLPLVYKRRGRPPAGDQDTTNRSLALAILASCLNQSSGTWRLSLLFRLACSPLYEHHGALQYSATSAPLLDVRPTVGTRINLVSQCCLAPAIERPISAYLLVSVGTTFRTDSWRTR
jgi:hypothetical protein